MINSITRKVPGHIITVLWNLLLYYYYCCYCYYLTYIVIILLTLLQTEIESTYWNRIRFLKISQKNDFKGLGALQVISCSS